MGMQRGESPNNSLYCDIIALLSKGTQVNAAMGQAGIGVSSKGMKCGACSCEGFQSSPGTNLCYVCSHHPTAHMALHSPLQPDFTSDTSTTLTTVRTSNADSEWYVVCVCVLWCQLFAFVFAHKS